MLEYGCPWERTNSLLWQPVQRKLAEYKFMIEDDYAKGSYQQFKDLMIKHMGKFLFFFTDAFFYY